MPFETDPQTLQDLALTGINGQAAILQLFKPVTLGGVAVLKEMFDRPLNDIIIIQNRLGAIRFLDSKQLPIRLNKEECDFIEYYLKQYERLGTTSRYRAIKAHIQNWLKPSSQYYITLRGVRLLVHLLHHIADVLNERHDLPALLKELQQQTHTLSHHIRPLLIQKSKSGQRFSAMELEELDFIFRYSKSLEVKKFMAALYQLDVFMAAAKPVRDAGFSYPEFITAHHPTLDLKGFFHPFIEKPIGNDIAFNYGKNLCFITGANMAGKSTVLKSIGICTYLAHVGLPVPAAFMQTTVFNGLFTTINLSDNIMAGHSHFYREVLRIKEVAVKVGAVQNLLVIFDELFRGTNVKDAYDASLSIIKAFTGVKNSVFIISTHIVEVAAELQDAGNLFFNCLTTGMVGDKAVYTYKLQPGISNERLGMRIIEDEGLVEIIRAQALT
ncbi:MAG: hypothetical protein V4592_13310 [Bacteroidota bacterium]